MADERHSAETATKGDGDSTLRRPTCRVALDSEVSYWLGGKLLAGGSPWRLVSVHSKAVPFATRLRAAGGRGTFPANELERSIAEDLLERGIIHPIAEDRQLADGHVVVIVPVYNRAALLDRCLASLGEVPVVVVDDASTDREGVRRVAERHGARLIRHGANRGPAAARNTGIASTESELIAFIDSDCVATPQWIARLAPLFDDPRVAVVGPRIVPRAVGESLLARHERARSALDQGRHPRLVRAGGQLGFLPSAALIVRRRAIADGSFDAALRMGEDVDLVWRLDEAGWHVRYDPRVPIWHEPRLHPTAWLRRRFEYGTSAADLDRRHPRKVTPMRIAAPRLATLLLLISGRGAAAASMALGTTTALRRQLGQTPKPWGIAARIMAKGFYADAVFLGQALRREWWPAGWLAATLGRRTPWGRAAFALMLSPLALEWLRQRPRIDPLRYASLRVLEDAAYGSGVIWSAVAGKRPGALVPTITFRLGAKRRSSRSAPWTPTSSGRPARATRSTRKRSHELGSH